MNRLLQRLFGIKEGEALKASLMFSYIFFIVASMMILKPVRNSLFLVKLGAHQLPYVFVLIAVVAALVDAAHSRIKRISRINFQILTTISGSGVCLLIFWFLIHSGYQSSTLLYAFYVWVSIYSVVTSAQFWLFANYVYNAREAKRLFGFIGAGAISGGIFGGYLTRYLAPRLRTENLIFFCIGFLLMCTILFLLVWSRSYHYIKRDRAAWLSDRSKAAEKRNPVTLILGSRHLSYLAGLIGIGVIVGDLAHFQFSDIASRTITDTDRLTAFFGFWMSNLSIASLVIQLLLTGRIIRRYGVGTSLFFLPLGLLAGAVSILVSPGLTSAILIKFSDGAFKHSINRGGTELLALPIPPLVKNKAKVFIDVVVKNLATGFAGVFLIILTIVIGLSVQHISIVCIALIAVWLYVIVRVKGEYVNSFRVAIEKRSIDLEEQSLNLEDAAVFAGLMNVLKGDNERQILYVLNLIEGVKNRELIPIIENLLVHPSSEIRCVALRMAHQYEEPDLSETVLTLIDDEDQAVRVEAIRYICQRSEKKVETLKNFLNSDNYRIQGAAIMCAAKHWRESKDFRDAVSIREILLNAFEDLQSKAETGEALTRFKINAAHAIGDAGDPELYPYLAAMFNDTSLDVVQAAVSSAGRAKDMELVSSLIRHLKTRTIRRYAKASLAMYGDAVIDVLAERLENPEEDYAIRREIPGVLALIGSQKSVNVLMKNLDTEAVFYKTVRALNKLRVGFPSLKFDRSSIEKKIFEATKQYYRALTLLRSQNEMREAVPARVTESENRSDDSEARKLLIRALEERLDHDLEMIFRFLGLRYPPKDIYDAYLGVMSQRSRLRADAIEFLDNVLRSDFKRLIIPIIEMTPVNVLLDMTKNEFGYSVHSEDESIEILLQGRDNWLRACTLYLIAEMRYDRYRDRIAEMESHPDPVVRETARFCLNRFGDTQ